MPSVSDLGGKSGEGLAAAVRKNYKPARLCPADALTLVIHDPFGGEDVRVEGGVWPAGYSAGGAVPPSWWIEGEYADTLWRDLVNLMPVNEDVARFRRDLPPGRTVERPVFANGAWEAGVATIDGIETELYAPPELWRGALARKYFYMAVCYPSVRRAPVAYMILTSGAFPGLTGYAADMLMAWHRGYAPSAGELRENELCESLQGSGNPFVTHPELAEYLWGAHSGEPFVEEGSNVPLHSTYRLADEWVYLTSPHIPEGAAWSVDGRSVGAASRLSVRELGLGNHDLTYSYGGATGRVMIKIVP